MASATTQLERIAALVDKLGPISNKQRGMRIEAEEWNALVDVLLGVLQMNRLQEQRTENLLDERFATREHEHLGQVSLEWLDADLQSRMGGGEKSIATRQLLAEMDRKIQSLSDQVSKLSSALESSQRVLDDQIVTNADRSRKLLGFEERFNGVENLRTTVSALANDVGSVRVNVDQVLELRRSLQDPRGNPINVVQLRQDLTELQSVRENLRGADGNLLRLRDLEARLQEVADVVGTGRPGGLEGRFATLSVSLEDSLAKRTEAKIAEANAALLAENSALESRLRGEIQTSSTQTRDALTQQFGTQIGATTATINTNVDSRLNGLTESVKQEALDSTRTLVNQRLSEVPDQIRTQLNTEVASLRTTLSANLEASLSVTLTAQIREADTRLGQRIDAVQASTTSIAQSIPSVVTAQLDNALPELETTLNQQIAAQVATSRTAIENGVDTRVVTAVSNSLQNLDSRISTAVTQQTATLDTRIATAVSAATRNVPAQVTDEVRLQITDANLDGRIEESARTVTTQLRSELRSSLAEQDVRNSSAIQSSVTLLQGQLSSSVSAALAEARDFSTAQTAGLRTDLTRLIETRVRVTQETILADVNREVRTSQEATTAGLRTEFESQIRSQGEATSARIRDLETRIVRVR